MKEKIIHNLPKTLFHLSEYNHDGEWFYPRVPGSICKEKDEDDKTKRVCFSSTMRGAFYAISPFGDRQNLYVHIPLEIENICSEGNLVKPSQKQVFDVLKTKEHWIKTKVKLKCIGRISIKYKENIFGIKFYLKWIERYENS